MACRVRLKNLRYNINMLPIRPILIASATVTLLLSVPFSAHAQTSALAGGVTALALVGDRLLIGQNATLVDAAITSTDLSVNRTIDLRQGAIRAIVPVTADSNPNLLILTEEGIRLLDPADKLLAYYPGGGQRLIVKGARVYVAALDAGVTIYALANGTLKPIGHVETPAEDLAPEGATWLWVAAGDQGVRLFDLTDPAKPSILYESDGANDLRPAHLVRTSGTHLFVGYADRLVVFDTLDIKAPRRLSDLALDSATASAGDLILSGGVALMGRIDLAGADVVLLDLANPKAIRQTATEGDAGAGDRIALHGSDLFVGSERLGLRRLHLSGTTVSAVAAWGLADSAPCTDVTPLNPNPPNLSEITRAASITLTWAAACPAPHYAVEVNGKRVAVTDQPRWTLTPTGDAIDWRVIALAADGSPRQRGPAWSFEFAARGYTATPPITHLESILYVPPRVLVDLSSPGAVIIETCAALSLGLLAIIGGAIAINGWSEHRRANQ